MNSLKSIVRTILKESFSKTYVKLETKIELLTNDKIDDVISELEYHFEVPQNSHSSILDTELIDYNIIRI